MNTLSELNVVEKPVAEWLSKMGWVCQSSDDLKVYNRPLSSPIIMPILVTKVAELNSIPISVAEQAVELLIHDLRNPSPILGNESFLDKLAGSVTITVDGVDRDIHFIEFYDIWQNSLIVTNQYMVQGFKIVKPDIVLLVNGIPLVCVEAKQCARKGTNWLEGVKQFSTYEQRSDKLFMSNLFGVACNGRIAKFGIPGASASYFNEWKDDSLDTSSSNPILDPKNDLCVSHHDPVDGLHHFEVGKYPNGEVMEKMKLGIVGLLQPARVLDILKNFIVFERTEGKVVKKVSRYQQLRAANKIVTRVIESDLKKGVIWHTQGSGKSLTMLYTAYKLCHAPELRDPTVYIVVDRKNLREQIGGTFDDCIFPSARPVYSIGDLKQIISRAPSGVFITTIQKFTELGDRADLRDNVIVLVDEAHRTQYGDFHTELMSVLPNARKFAFTGTPIPKTYQVFGEKKKEQFEHYLDRYSIQDSIDDGATVPIRYTFGPQRFFLDKEKLKQGYEEITQDLEEVQKRLVEKRAQPWKVFLKHPERIAVLAADIAKDFREVVEPQGFKVQIVACDKEACVLYYNELLNYFDHSEMTIIFSIGQYEESDKYELFSPHYKEDTERKRLITQFKRRITPEEQRNGNNLKILIVCNMLLTGFDAPIEQTMYLDSPLRDHNLLQAVARTNRPYDDPISKLSKAFGRIVDYIGIFENYRDALNYEPEDIGEFEDVDSLVLQFPDVLNPAMQPFVDIKLEDSYECSMAIIRRLSELDQGKFEDSYREVVQLWEAISPHPGLREHIKTYRWLNAIYEIYMEEYRRQQFDAEFYAAKTRKLIQENSKLIDFKGHLPEIKIDSDYIQKLKDSKLNPSDKAEKLIRDIETVIRKNEANSAVYVEFQTRLEELIRQKQRESEAIEQILLKLEDLYTELDEISFLPKKMGFEDKGAFEIFMVLKNASENDFDEVLSKEFSIDVCDNLIKKKIYIGWQDIPQEVSRVKVEISIFAVSDHYQSLNLEDSDEVMDMIMLSVIRNFSLK